MRKGPLSKNGPCHDDVKAEDPLSPPLGLVKQSVFLARLQGEMLELSPTRRGVMRAIVLACLAYRPWFRALVFSQVLDGRSRQESRFRTDPL